MYIVLGLIFLFVAQGIYRNWDVYTGKSQTFDALAAHLNERGEIQNAFPDDSQFEKTWWGRVWKAWKKLSKPWFAFGPLSNYWWARFRKAPVTLFATFGPGESRWENDFMALRSTNQNVYYYVPSDKHGAFYLSRVQYWCDWHIQLQWPLFFSCHKGKWQFYAGIKRDRDNYWLSFYPGKTWK